MFRSAALQLTLWYLALIMALSLVFSFALYRISTGELNRGFRRQDTYFNQLRLAPPPPRPQNPTLERFREMQLAEGRRRLLEDLAVFNLVTLVLGGAASYALAKRTLYPIEEAMESQSRFTADASHELRTPLTAMQTEIEVALRSQQLTKEEAKALLQSNLEEVAKLRALSDGLLTLASHDSKGMVAEPVPLEQIALEVVARLEKVAAEKSITIENQLKPAKVQGDRPSLTELISILLDNAIKYSPAKTKITLTARRTGKSVYVSVADQGEGIKPEDLPHIFDRFYRADLSRSKKKTEGYGLGLSIAKKIADLHGGYIEASSAPGKGSTFTVKLPLASEK